MLLSVAATAPVVGYICTFTFAELLLVPITRIISVTGSKLNATFPLAVAPRSRLNGVLLIAVAAPVLILIVYTWYILLDALYPSPYNIRSAGRKSIAIIVCPEVTPLIEITLRIVPGL